MNAPTDLAVRTLERRDLAPTFVISRDAWAYAKALSSAEATPKAYRGKPADVFLIMQAAVALDVPVYAALAGVNVVEGKAEAGAELMLALVRRAGHKVRHGGDRRAAWIEITRSDDPDFTYRETFDLDDAEQAELCKITDREHGRVRARSRRGEALPWEKYTRVMLRWRVISQAVSYACPEVLLGVRYVNGEVGGPIDPAALAVAEILYSDDELPDGTAPAAAPVDEQQPAGTDTPADVVDAAAADTAPPPASQANANALEWRARWLVEIDDARNGRDVSRDLERIAELGQKALSAGHSDLADEAQNSYELRQARGNRAP